MSPRISIITPTYNHEQFIGDCVHSVLSQTFSDWEMIIVDDGSTDGTATVVKSFADSRIKYLYQGNAGISRLHETYNRALREATGDMIAILEGDDYWPADKLEIHVKDFDDPAVVLSSGLTAVDRGDGSQQFKTVPVEIPPEDVRNNRPVGRAAKQMVSHGTLTYTFPVSTVMRADALRRIGGFQQPSYLLVVDFPTFLRMTIEGEFRFHDHVLGYWRRHVSSVTLSRMPEIMEGAYRYAFEFLQTYRDRLPLTDQELDEIERHWDEVNAMNCILRGRMLSKAGISKLAAKAFRECNFYDPPPKTKTLANIAASLASIGMPVEPIYRMLGRVPLDQATTIDTGDRIVSEDDMKRARYVGRWRKPA